MLIDASEVLSVIRKPKREVPASAPPARPPDSSPE
jgi:hypothetical protein